MSEATNAAAATPVAVVAVTAVSATDQREAEWRGYVRESLGDLRHGQDDLHKRFESMDKANAEQHGQLAAQLALDKAELAGRLDAMAAGIKASLEEANRRILEKDKVLRIAALVIFFLAGWLVGAKTQVIQLLKAALGLG